MSTKPENTPESTPVSGATPSTEPAPAAPAGSEAAAETSLAEASEDKTLNTLVTELKEAKQIADEAQDQALRAQAEMQNFRRRKEREASERAAQANARLLKELLPIIDDFERAFANVPDTVSPEEAAWLEGFQLIQRKLRTLLDREGITAIDATGAFDPTVHEAVSVEDSDDVPSGEIIAEVQRGYKLHDKVLRPSYVRVAQ